MDSPGSLPDLSAASTLSSDTTSGQGKAKSPDSSSIDTSILGDRRSKPVAPEADLPFLSPKATKLSFEKGLLLAQELADRVGLQWNDLTAHQRIRAQKIQSEDFTWSPNRGEAPPNQRYVTTFKKEWNDFVESLPEAHKAELLTFENVFFDEEATTAYMTIHRQLSGVCGSHAAASYQHEVESCRKQGSGGKTNHRVLDISDFFLNYIDEGRLKSYILEGVIRMSAMDLLQTITETDYRHFEVHAPVMKTTKPLRHAAHIEELYSDFHDTENVRGRKEPGLLCRFMVEPEFLKTEKTIYHGAMNQKAWEQKKKEHKDNTGSYHSMILIGAYKTEGRTWFVLKNTHENAYFKIVDGEYLASCCAEVCFAHASTDMSLKDTFSVVDGEYHEAWFEMEECMPTLAAEEN